MPADAPGMDQGYPANGTKIKLLTRSAIDGRCAAAKLFDSVEGGIVSDLGGITEMTTVERHLASAFAGCSLHLHHINARLMLGEKVDLVEHATAISSLVRIAARLPDRRRSRDVTPPNINARQELFERLEQIAIRNGG